MMGRHVDLPPLEEILAAVAYNPMTGEFTRLLTGRKIAACRKSGYVKPRIGSKRCMGHRLAWYIMTGAQPTGMLDHVDGNRSNNRIENLRLATATQNAANRKPSGLSKYRGLTLSRGRWNVVVRSAGKKKYIGRSKCEAAAALMYDKAALEMHGEFAWLNHKAARVRG